MVSQELQRIPMSYEEWEALPAKPKAEWVDGVAIMSPYQLFDHQDAGFLLTALLRRSLAELSIAPEVTIRLSPTSIRVPDVSAFTQRPDGPAVELIPVLVAEVLSPSTRGEDLLRKAPEYLAAGISQYWVVERDPRRIEVYRNDGSSWVEVAMVTEEEPTASVQVGEHGTVEVVLGEILPG